MLPTDIADHRKSRTAELLSALARGDPLALAEAYHRTSAAAYACARRLVGTREEVEALLRSTYMFLWQEPPVDAPLEAWIRHRVFVEGRAHLREHGRGAASPSTALLLRDGPPPEGPLDHAEQLIASLDDDALRALLLAHDRGIPTADQRGEDAEKALRRALFVLAEAEDPGGCTVPGLADLALGLLDEAESDRLVTAASSARCTEVLRTLRRGRRRIEGLPPSPDLGHRVVAYALAGGGVAARRNGEEAGGPAAIENPGPETAAPAPSVLHGDLEEASGGDEDGSPSALDALIGEDEAPRQREATGLEEPADAWTGLEDEEGEPPPFLGGVGSERDETAPLRDRGAPISLTEVEQAPPWRHEGAAREPGEDSLAFGTLDAEEDDRAGSRRVLTLVLTVLGALLLLAAGAVAGLLAINIFLG